MTATHLYIDFGDGYVDFGPAPRPHDGIGAVRRILSAHPDIAAVSWHDPDALYTAFVGRRAGSGSFGWKSPAMPGTAFAELAS